jgi:hypothetical protein
MRTTYIAIILIGTLSLTAFNCNISTSSSSRQDDKFKKDVRTVEKFDGIGLGISADVKLTQGSPQNVTIEGNANDLEKIITEIDGSTLKIRSKPGSWHMNKVTVYITMESVKNLHISGSGSVIAQNTISTDNLDLHISGSGSLEISDLKAGSISSHISGSGKIKLSGKSAATQRHEIHISGSGDVLASELLTQNVDVHISGSGNCKINASTKLSARVSGSGDVYYSGKPLIDASVSGSGKIKEMSL